MEHRIVDYRNAKFQGQTIDKQPNGFGIVLDQNYTFIIGQLISGILNGPIAIVFDDSTKLYGDLFDISNGILVYADTLCKIYKNKTAIVMDYISLKTLFKLEQIKTPSTPTRRTVVTDTKVKIIKQKIYMQQNYLQVLAQLLQSKTISSKYLSYQNFIKETFRVKYKNLLNFFQSSKEFSLSFRNQGIFLKLSKKTDVVLSVGFNGIDKKPQIGRKYNYYRDFTNCLVQQFIQIQPSTLIQFDLWQTGCQQPNSILATAINLGVKTSSSYNKNNKSYKQTLKIQNKSSNALLKQKNRPKECIKNLREYYKRSLTFLNKYLNLSQVYEIKQQFQKLFSHTINNVGHLKYAQTQMENNGYILDQKQQPIITKQNQVITYQASVKQWKKEIERTVSGSKARGKRLSNNTNIQDFSKSTSRKTYDNYVQQNNSPQKSQKIKKNQKSYTPHKQNQKYINPERQNYRNDRSKSRRQIKYLDSEIEEKSQIMYKNSKNSYLKSEQSSIRKSPVHYKYNYTDQYQSKKKIQQTDYKNSKKLYRY